MNDLHAMARTIVVVRTINGKSVRERMTNRRAMLALSRHVNHACSICRDTGVHRTHNALIVYDEHKAHMGEVSEEQVRFRQAWNDIYCTPVPCFNPACTAERPADRCPTCGGFGQRVVDGTLTDTICEDCRGFGYPQAVTVREAA